MLGLGILVALAIGWPRFHFGAMAAIARAPVDPFAVTFL